MLRDNLSVLPLWESRDHQHRNKSYVYDCLYPVLTSPSQIPPFQLNVPSGTTVSSILLINLEDDSSEEILPLLVLGGFVVSNIDSDSVMIYPSKTLIPFISIKTGVFELVITSSTKTWYTGAFKMCPNFNNYIKLEFSHSRNIVHSKGLLVYDNFFINHIYIDPDSYVGKPLYKTEQRIDKREVIELPNQRISYKLYRFVKLIPEFMIDIISTIDLHDFKYISYGESRHRIDEIEVESEWLNRGDLTEATFNVKTDMTIIVDNGKGLII